MLLVGLSGVGKTTLVRRLQPGRPPEARPTRRTRTRTVKVGPAELEFVDTPGSRAAESLWRLAEAAGRLDFSVDLAIYMYDLTRPETLAGLVELAQPVRRLRPARAVVLGNKADLAMEAGAYVDAGPVVPALGAAAGYTVSALTDDPAYLAKVVLDSLLEEA